MKLKKFPVSSAQGEVLNWSMGLFLAFSAVNLADHWTSSPNEGQSMFTEAFASLQSSSGIQIAEAVLLLSTKLVMWEILRRNLKKNSHFFFTIVSHHIDGSQYDSDSCHLPADNPYRG